MKRFFVCLISLFFVLITNAQDITGVWKGTLSYMGSELDIYFTISKDSNGDYSTVISVPDQGSVNIPADSVIFDGIHYRVVVNKVNMSYKGVFLKNTFLGDYFQNGLTIPLTLSPGAIPVPKRPQTPVPPYPYKEEEVVFQNTRAGIQMAGTLTLPQGDGPFPAVVLITGSGYQNRDEEILGHKPFLVIADYLTKNGIAVLRYDDRGVGSSEGSINGNTSEDLSYDAQAAVEYLLSRQEIGKVGVCGHSEGGCISFMLAARYPRISFVVSLAGTATTGAEVLLAQQRAIGKVVGFSDDILDSQEATNKVLYDMIIAADTLSDTLSNSLFDKMKEIMPQIPESQIKETIEQIISPWMFFFIRYSAYDDIKAIKVPILALNGTNDLQVISSHNLPLIEKACEESGNKELTIKYLDGLNHLFQHSETGSPNDYGLIEETIAPEVLEILTQWINERK